MDSQAERLHWPFFGEEHRRLAAEVEDWARANLADGAHPEGRAAVDMRCRTLVAALGKAGILKHCLRAADGGAAPEFDARSIGLVLTLPSTKGFSETSISARARSFTAA